MVAPRAAATIRAATPQDVAAIAEVAAACDEPIDTPGRSGSPYAEHLVGRGVALVAELDGRVVAYAGLVDLGASVHLSDLFVSPAHQGQGLGSLLLAAILPRDVPASTFSSADPRALPLYLRAGLGAWWPNLYLRGETSGLPTAAALGGLAVERVDADTAAAAWADLEAGADRGLDVAFWTALPGGGCVLLRDGGAVAGLAVATDGRTAGVRRLVRLAMAADADPVAVVATALHWAGPAGTVARLTVPGPHPALPILLRAGFRIVDRDTFLASDPSLVDARRTLPDPSFR